MQIQMGIVGQPNVTITITATPAEMAAISNQQVHASKMRVRAALAGKKVKKVRSDERIFFDMCRKRFAKQGAEETNYFLLT